MSPLRDIESLKGRISIVGKGIKGLKKYKWLMYFLVIFVTMLFFLLGKFVYPQVVYDIGESTTEIYSIYYCGSVEEELHIQNARQLKIYGWSYYDGISEDKEFEISCTDGEITCSRTYNLRDIPSEMWTPIVFQEDELKSMRDTVRLSIKDISLDENNGFNIQVITNEHLYEGLHVDVQDESIKNSTLSMAYRYFEQDNFFPFLVTIFGIAVVLVLVIYAISKYIINYPVIIIMLVYTLIMWLKMDVWNTDISGFMQHRYAASYQYGVYNETLIGTICNFFVDRFTIHNTKIIATILELIELITFIVLFLQMYKKNVKNLKDIELFSLLFVVSPFFLTSHFTSFVYGFYDAIIISIFIICMLIAYRERGLYWIPLISVVGVLSYKSFVFGCFPILFLYLIYRGVQCKKKKYFVVAVLTLLIDAFVCIFLQFFGTFSSLSEVVEQMQEHVEWQVNGGVVYSHYFSNIQDQLNFVKLNAGDKYGSVYIYYFTVLALLPMLIYWIRLQKRYIITAKLRIKKIIMILAIASGGITFATFVIQADWGRYTNVFFTSIFVMMYLLLCDKSDFELNEAMIIIHTDNNNKYGKYWSMMLVIYLFSISCGGASSITQVRGISESILNMIQDIIL